MSKKIRFSLFGVALLLVAMLVGGHVFVLHKRDSMRWGCSAQHITYGQWCAQDYRSIAAWLELYCEEHGTCPEDLSGLGREPHCSLGRREGKVGRLVYLGKGKVFTGPLKWRGQYSGQSPVLFDYPDNHPEGGYALMADGTIVRFKVDEDWRSFLQEWLPEDYPLEDNDLAPWQWKP